MGTGERKRERGFRQREIERGVREKSAAAL